MHESDTANEAQLEPSEIYMTEFFCETFNGFSPLTIFTKKFHHIGLWHGSKYTYEPQT